VGVGVGVVVAGSVVRGLRGVAVGRKVGRVVGGSRAALGREGGGRWTHVCFDAFRSEDNLRCISRWREWESFAVRKQVLIRTWKRPQTLCPL